MLKWEQLLSESEILQHAIPIQIAKKSSDSEENQLLVFEAFKQLLAGNTCFDLPNNPNGQSLDENASILGESQSGKPLLKINEKTAQLNRVFVQENEISNWIKSNRKSNEQIELSELDKEQLRNLFSNKEETNPQYQAVIAALNHNLVLLTGGPGTGKTYTIVRMVAGLFIHTDLKSEKLVLAAPTGKAASRMAESIRNEILKIPLAEEVRNKFPKEGSTLHRLLGITDNPLNARYNKTNPLPYDVIIIDEASMIDINLFHALISALPSQCKLIFVGDQDQLPSVEAGRILADFCKISEQSDYVQHAQLTETHRFNSTSGIGRLAKLVNEHKPKEVEALFDSIDLDFIPATSLNEYQSSIKSLMKDQLEELSNSTSPKNAFESFKKIKILTALRIGLTGSEGINSFLIGNQNRFGSTWRHGMPIMVTKNDYNLNLFNSDIGMFLSDEDKSRVYFESTLGEYRAVNPSLLQHVESAYAMTVHKSQGSEFEHVIFVLPDLSALHSGAESLLTRELIYTAITRAQKKFTLIGSMEQFKEAMGRHLKRKSDLVRKVME